MVSRKIYYSLNYLNNTTNNNLIKDKKNNELLYHDYFIHNIKNNDNYIEILNILYTSDYQKISPSKKVFNNLKNFNNYILQIFI